MKNFLTEQEIKELEARYLLCKDRRQADRIITILYLNKGYNYE